MRFAQYLAIATTILLASYASFTQPGKPDFSVADKFFDTYLTGNIAALEPMMTDEFRFQDTASDFRGKQAATQGLKKVFKNFTMGKFTEHSRFHSGNAAVYIGKIRFVYKGHALGFPGTDFEFNTSFVVSLTMDGKKVNHHIDYVDTDAFTRQLNSQIEKIRKLNK